MMTSFISLFIVLSTWIAPPPVWLTDFDQATKVATQSKKMILVNFSGSDWCGPCIQMKKRIFDSRDFETYAQKNIVLLSIDFPRMKRRQLSEDQTRKNEALAKKYDPRGVLPYTMLINPAGKVLQEWVGAYDGDPDTFISEIEVTLNAK